MPRYQFRNDYSALPPWLTTGNAERYEYAMRLCFDLLLEKANEAVEFRLPGKGDPSQLPYLANDRGLAQGPGETAAAFVLRLQSAIPDWGIAGSARSVLREVQAYMQNLQPGVGATLPLATIVGGPYGAAATWQQLYQGDVIGALPTLSTVAPSNFNWDWNPLSPLPASYRPWRAWLVLHMARVATGQSGSTARITTATGGSFTSPGQNVGGVWVPAVSGTPVNTPMVRIINLSHMTAANVGQWITLSGAVHSANNGTFQIVQRLSSSSVIIANPAGVATDAGPLTWSVSAYPYMAPGLRWGAPGVTFGQGELTVPAVDTGHNFQGVWQPRVTAIAGLGALSSWGLAISAQVIVSIRQLVQTWKSAGTYYPTIIVAFDGGTGVAGSAYSPNSTQGAGNPDGTFGSVGKLVGGVWVPSRLITSDADCYCQGTGRAQACSVENVT